MKINLTMLYVQASEGQLHAQTRERLRSHLNSLPLFQTLEPEASHKRASRALRIFYTYLSLVSQTQSR